MLGELKLEGYRLRLAASNNEIGEVHGTAVGQEIVRRCNEYPTLVAGRATDLEAKVWAEFASAASVGLLASECEAEGIFKSDAEPGGLSRHQKIADESAATADTLLAEWKKRFGTKPQAVGAA